MWLLPGYRAIQAGALVGLLSGGLSLPHIAEAVAQNNRQGESTRLTAGDTVGVGEAPPNAQSNPFVKGDFASFTSRFDIPSRHGAGVRVDLANDKEVKGKTYREAGGRCPVFGKNIILYQPSNNPHYGNDFLNDIPTEAQSKASGHPLPGGFNNSLKLGDGSPASPMSLSRLNSLNGLKAKTPLGKCAELSYSVRVPNSEYRYPFVYDQKNELCYLLSITMQRLMGERYCSKDNKPRGLTWYCFEPNKSEFVRPELAYGSSYVGEHPDEWEAKCPTKAVKDAVFGVWRNGVCHEHRHDPKSIVQKVKRKEECWALAFNNENSASDHPVSSSENIGTVGYYFPLGGPNQPKSKGEGRNYASFYGGGYMECVLSSLVPNCFVFTVGAVAYNALGGLEEETLPKCTPDFQHVNGSCDNKRCLRSVTSCKGGMMVALEEACTPDDGSKCESNLSLVIGLSVAGGLLLLILAGTSLYFYRRRRSKGHVALPEESRSQYLQEEASAQRKNKRASDLVQQAEPSFWGEEAEDVGADGGDTQVLIDQDY